MALAWESLRSVARNPSLIKHHVNERLWRHFGSLAYAEYRDIPYTIAQLGQSLDGRIATRTGHSRYINGKDALVHLHRLRALVDGVVIGASTGLVDDPALTVRLCDGRHPARVLIDRNRRIPAHANVFADNGARVLLIGPPRDDDPSHLEILKPPRPDQSLHPREIIALCAQAGLRRLLIEGGAATVSRFLSDGALDRLHLLVGPIIIGSGQSGIALPEIDHLDDAIRPTVTVDAFASGDALIDCRFTELSEAEAL
ncbi:MAG: RibD family protein [Pseudomonadota bacterium]